MRINGLYLFEIAAHASSGVDPSSVSGRPEGRGATGAENETPYASSGVDNREGASPPQPRRKLPQRSSGRSPGRK